MIKFRLAGALGLLILVAACGGGSQTPAPTATPTLPPGVTPTITPSATVTPSVTPSPTPFQVSGSGSLVYSVPADSPDSITSVDLRPGRPEILINLKNGTDTHVAQSHWDTPQLQTDLLSDHLSNAHYAPDGTHILYDGLTLSDPDGTHIQALTQNDAGGSWSPDGKQIAFIRAASGDANCVGENPINCTSVMIDDLSAPVGAKPRTITTQLFLGGAPIWSPDQKRLLMQQGGEVGSSLVVLNLADATLTTLVPNSATPNDAYGFNNAVWAPDSQSVVYAAQFGGLWQQPITGGAPTLLAEAGSAPFWSPGGHWLYYLETLPDMLTATPPPGIVPQQQVWRLDPSNPKATTQRVLDATFACNTVNWFAPATLACIGTVNQQQAVTLYAIPVTP